ncbi:MAG: nitronate monooxygenase [Steroidobacteraceae bacterium]
MRTFEDNRVVRHTGSKYPIFQAPIGGMSRAQWAGAVSAAGGMGLIATNLAHAIVDTKDLDKDGELIRQKTHHPFGYHLVPDMLSVQPEKEAEVLNWLEKNRNPFVAIGYSGYSIPGAKDKWRFVKRLKEAGKTCYFIVDSLEEALRSEDAGVDGLIANGADAGGLRSNQTLHIFSLIQQVRQRTDLPLVAAGGIANGIGMAGAFALGAEGILMGTRFMASTECPIHENYKQTLADAKQIYHMDVGIPDSNMLVVANDYSDKFKRGEIARDGNAYGGDARACFFQGRTDLAMVGGGESAVLVDAIKPVAQIMDETVAGFWKEIDRLARLGLPGQATKAA